MTNIAVPDMSVARGGLAPPGHIAYQGGPLVAVAPPPVMPQPERGKRQRVVGLVPASPGAQFALVRKEAPTNAPSPQQIAKARALLRSADAHQRAAELAWGATATGDNRGGDTEKLREAREAGERAAMAKRTLAEMEALGTGRPVRVEMAVVREPGEVADRLADAPPAFVCLHDGCRGKQWGSEGELRAAHPTHNDMVRAQACHVYAVLCDAPLDPEDPHGERVGYVAPKGRDGTTIASAVQQTERQGESVESLKLELAELRAIVESMGAKGKAK